MDLSLRVQFHSLVKRQEGEEWAVGRMETGSFIYLPREGVELIELLEEGRSMAEAAALFAQRHGETPDVADFVQGLNEVGFVAGTGLDLPQEPSPAVGERTLGGHFASIRPEAAARFFARPLLLLYLLFIAGAAAVMLITPGYLPRSIDQLWHPWLMLSSLSLAVFGWARTFVHEFFHLLAARSKGLGASMGIGRRFITPVAITEIPAMYAVSPRDRYLPYVAGMLWEGLLAGAIIALMALHDWGLLPLPHMFYLFLKGALVTTVSSLLWQTRLPLRTDLYFVLANWLQARNLHGDSAAYLQNLWARIRRRRPPHDLSSIGPREKRLIRLYAPILVGGVTLYWVSFVYLTIPFLVKAIPMALKVVQRGWEADPWAFGDSLIFLLLFGINWAWVGVVAARVLLRGRQQPTSSVPG